MIRVAFAVAWREVRLCAYRCAAIAGLAHRAPYFGEDEADSLACDAERIARAMLDAEGRT